VLSNSDLVELTTFRRKLHMQPEVSGEEKETAKTIAAALELLNPTRILTGLGGHGVAAEFDSGVAGDTVLFRAELDALPIQELLDADWVSQVDGKGHLCGHDGHMTMLLGFARLLKRRPHATGRVILMFQPAEEDGSGARAVVADPAYQQITPDWAFAIHNEPGRAFGYVSTRAGLINCASMGLGIHLQGKTAHAASPEDGISPTLCVSELLPLLDKLGEGGELGADFKLATITHVNIGEPTFGIAPGQATINVTLRTTNDHSMAAMEAAAIDLAKTFAQKFELNVQFETCDVFAASVNDEEATNVAKVAMDAINVPNGDDGLPMRASEDFGVFGQTAKTAMLCLGPGVDYPALHNPDYDFPDDLIPIGAAIFERIARDLLGSAKK